MPAVFVEQRPGYAELTMKKQTKKRTQLFFSTMLVKDFVIVDFVCTYRGKFAVSTIPQYAQCLHRKCFSLKSWFRWLPLKLVLVLN